MDARLAVYILPSVALGNAMREVNAAIEEMRREHDPLAVHIFVSRQNYRNVIQTGMRAILAQLVQVG